MKFKKINEKKIRLVKMAELITGEELLSLLEIATENTIKLHEIAFAKKDGRRVDIYDNEISFMSDLSSRLMP